jgi:DNA-binding FadR family transcriptional regulator
MTIEPPALRRADWEPRASERNLRRAEAAAERLAAMAADLEPGQRLGTKDELRALCGVSVGTFNEALRMAHARGVVTVRPGPGGGLFASRQTPMVRLGNSVLALDEDAASVADAVRMRDALDPLLIEDALACTTASDVAAMRATLDQMKVAADECDGIAFLHANWALHARIADISPTPILRSLYLSLLDIIESHTLSVQPVDEPSLPQYIHSRYDLHAALVDAIADGHPRALDIIREHNTSGSRVQPAAAH